MDGTLCIYRLRNNRADCFTANGPLLNEVTMKEQATPQAQDSQTGEPQSADKAVDQKNHHDDNDNEFSPGFKPNPDRPAPSDATDADIDTDGG
ncbi:hypothetical protein [Pseudomonas sp. PB3P13]